MLNPTHSEQTGGTGFQIETPEGPRILTNAHVCALGARDGLLWSTHAWKDYPTYLHVILKVDRKKDLCLLTPRLDIHTLNLSKLKAFNLDSIYVVGHPALEELTLAKGEVRADTEIHIAAPMLPGEPDERCKGEIIEFFGRYCITPFKATSTSLVIYGGNSGSPVVNSFGQVVGVVFAGSTRTNHGYYVPFDLVQSFLGIPPLGHAKKVQR